MTHGYFQGEKGVVGLFTLQTLPPAWIFLCTYWHLKGSEQSDSLKSKQEEL